MSGVRIQILKKEVGLKLVPCTALLTSYSAQKNVSAP